MTTPLMISARLAAFGAMLALAAPAQAGEYNAWDDIVANAFDDRKMIASDVVTIEAPYRAEDAALVPMTLRTNLPEGDRRRVERITLVIDENPAPVAATFELGPNSGVSEIQTRVRVNAYTPVHVVAELSDGTLHVTETFVKASGGCAAPMAKDPEAAMKQLGKMKMRFFDEAEGAEPKAEAQLMIRHPNNSGFQMDQLTRYYIPAHFVSDVTVRQGEDLVLRMEGGISISEDPNFRFDYAPNGAPLSVEVKDTEGDVFHGEWVATSS